MIKDVLSRIVTPNPQKEFLKSTEAVNKGVHLVVLMCMFILVEFRLKAQSVTLYAIPSPYTIRWDSPFHLATSMALNMGPKKQLPCPPRELGHVLVGLERNGDTSYYGMGFKKRQAFLDAVLKDHCGMYAVFKIYEGGLETCERLKPEIEYRMRSGKIAFITYRITDEAYLHLQNYLDSFCQLGYQYRYNGLNQPRHGLGTGCSAFGISFLEIIGIMEEEYQREWVVNIPIPDELIGDPKRNKHVKLHKVIFASNWAIKGQPYKNLRIYEPNLMFDWIHRKHRMPNSRYVPVSMYQSKGLIVDCRQKCAPQYPLFFSQN